jgi:hypothetical protein
VKGDWHFAKVWLLREMKREEREGTAPGLTWISSTLMLL